ncbi:hypothetical protein BCR34DRAFT_590716 [Clohesyomyces aquaticus]|uniref:Uncharacterized protein n=1 Tax=Clohesyomyces aquaticus TaxID=1231657 RepID=A0A1Y1Z7B4_9PLEO|nr:hypothetical protein BCR34DRAFT_590716 [Clohesyomyces aquaticus]
MLPFLDDDRPAAWGLAVGGVGTAQTVSCERSADRVAEQAPGQRRACASAVVAPPSGRRDDRVSSEPAASPDEAVNNECTVYLCTVKYPVYGCMGESARAALGLARSKAEPKEDDDAEPAELMSNRLHAAGPARPITPRGFGAVNARRATHR